MSRFITNNKDYSHLSSYQLNATCFILSVLGSSLAVATDGKIIISTMLVRGVLN